MQAKRIEGAVTLFISRLIAVLILMTPPMASVANDVVAVRSRTDQFIVYGFTQMAKPQALQSVPLGQGHLFWAIPNKATNDLERVELIPSLVAVCSERIKEAFLRELGERDEGGRRIHILLNPEPSGQHIGLVADRYVSGWAYGIQLPTKISSERFISAILQVLLVEMANRNAAEQQMEVPDWLLAGMIGHLKASRLETFALQPNLQVLRETKNISPAIELRQKFGDQMPLTFDELSWPKTLSPEKAAMFRDSAHLFVHELLRDKEGRTAMRRFILELSQHKNWQFAFLKAFNFSHLVDAEKWWALKFASFVGRDPGRLLSREESWERVKAALDVPVRIHLKNDRLPVAGQLSLQEVIEQWDLARQEVTLRKTVSQLQNLRYRVAPEFVALVDDYRKTLETYLENRILAKPKPGVAISPVALAKMTRRQLDGLDERRARLRKDLVVATPAAAPEKK